LFRVLAIIFLISVGAVDVQFSLAQDVDQSQRSADDDDRYGDSQYAGRYPGRYAASRPHANHRFRPDYDPDGSYRQPVSMVILDGEQALVATKRTGEIYQFDIANRTVRLLISEEERQFGRMIKLEPDTVAVADERNDEVVIYRRSDQTGWTLDGTVSVRGMPGSLCYDESESQLWVSSVWGQRLLRFSYSADSSVKPVLMQTIDLPMCGGRVLCLPDEDLVLVTDAFGCDFVMIEQTSGDILNHDQLYGHNICELTAFDGGESVLFPQQLLNGLAAALQTDITWGNFLSNNLRWIRTDQLAGAAGKEIYNGSRFVPIGTVGNGAGDPTSMAVHGNQIAITIGGTNQVALGTFDSRQFDFVDVGFRPIDCEYSDDGRSLIVVNQFSDSLSVIDIANFETEHVPLGKLRPPTRVELGERLFHDSTLSHDGWMSCQSCHSGGHTNGLLTDNFTDNTYQSPKRVLSLLGQAETAPYSWAGTMQTLEDQIAFSIKSTMASDHAVRPEAVEQIAAYVRTLPRPPSLAEARGTDVKSKRLAHQVRRGRQFFESAGCTDCHRKPLFTSDETYDVGLADERSMRHFNPPSLIAVSQRRNALFHDARAKSLREVVFEANHQMPDDTTNQQRRDLVQYLNSL
tara:strand:- start:28980 stop:30875 length:1896 start_codon:yes stop_codon:yes gene_type:complete